MAGVERCFSLNGQAFEVPEVTCSLAFEFVKWNWPGGGSLGVFEVGDVASWEKRQFSPLLQCPLIKKLHGIISSVCG